MKASPLTEGLVFAIDMLVRTMVQNDAAEHLVRGAGVTLSDPADRAVIHKMKADGSVDKKTIAFIRKHGSKPTPAARRKTVRA